MFGSKRNRIQVKSVEDYLRVEDARIPVQESRSKTPLVIPPHVKLYIFQGVAILFVVALVLVAFSQLSTIKSQVAELQAGNQDEVKTLKTQVTELSAKLEKSGSEVAALSETVAGLKAGMEEERAEHVRAEAAAAEKRAAAATGVRKKAVR